MTDKTHALIVGAGDGLSASLARLFAAEGMNVGLAARHPEKLTGLCSETGAEAFACDAAREDQVLELFRHAESVFGPVGVVVYNASARVRGPITELDPPLVRNALDVSAFGGFLVGQAAAKSMLARGAGGAIFFTGASASVKGYAQSASFAMGKFALRGLAQSMARELAPQNIHVAHFVIDGAILPRGSEDPADRPDSRLHPDAIAETYLAVLRQHRSAWTWEVELRPWVEKF